MGLVIDYKDGIATIEERNYFKIGDEVQFFGPSTETKNFRIEEILDEDGKIVEEANHPQMIVKIRVPFELKKHDMMRLKVFDF